RRATFGDGSLILMRFLGPSSHRAFHNFTRQRHWRKLVCSRRCRVVCRQDEATIGEIAQHSGWTQQSVFIVEQMAATIVQRLANCLRRYATWLDRLISVCDWHAVVVLPGGAILR